MHPREIPEGELPIAIDEVRDEIRRLKAAERVRAQILADQRDRLREAYRLLHVAETERIEAEKRLRRLENEAYVRGMAALYRARHERRLPGREAADA